MLNIVAELDYDYFSSSTILLVSSRPNFYFISILDSIYASSKIFGFFQKRELNIDTYSPISDHGISLLLLIYTFWYLMVLSMEAAIRYSSSTKRFIW
jgi:hypothetical protein